MPTRKKPRAGSSKSPMRSSRYRGASTSRKSTSRFSSVTGVARPSTARASNPRSSVAGSRCTNPGPSSPSLRPALSCSRSAGRRHFFRSQLRRPRALKNGPSTLGGGAEAATSPGSSPRSSGRDVFDSRQHCRFQRTAPLKLLPCCV